MRTTITVAFTSLLFMACAGTSTSAPEPPADSASAPGAASSSAASSSTSAAPPSSAVPPVSPVAAGSDRTAKPTGGESIAVSHSCTLPTPPGLAAIRLSTDVVYASPNGTPQRLDVIQPKTPGVHPLVVLIHGGGWTKGDKAGMRQLGGMLTSLGYVAATVNYRLVQPDGSNAFPAQVSDVRCALRWLRAHAATYGIDTTRVASLGLSAGAQLAAMLGVADGVSGLDDGTCPAELAPQSVSVTAAVGYYTPTDFRDPAVWANNENGGSGVVGMLGGPMDKVAEIAALASPITHVSAASAPFFLAHGTADTTVPIAQSETFLAALHAAGAKATLVEVEGAEHGFPVVSEQYPASSCTALAFLNEYLGP